MRNDRSVRFGVGMKDKEFLTQEEAVVAHLFWAMAAVEVVSIAIAGRSVSGQMLAPDPDLHAAIFEPSPGQELPERVLRKGKIVLVKYASLEDEYQFKSQLIEAGPARWILAIPRDVRRTDRRQRHHCYPGALLAPRRRSIGLTRIHCPHHCHCHPAQSAHTARPQLQKLRRPLHRPHIPVE